ncbi:MAG: hypothetical protein C0621_01415 [Desulfuromonas sp.]|nr:MAG: hypothetical protein C0621_01415 [Desulfuromonas sp.]
MTSRYRKERVRVAVIFEPGGRLRPVWFEWEKRRCQVRETTYRWQGQRGSATLLHFAVCDEAALYELTYNLQEQSWAIEQIEAL